MNIKDIIESKKTDILIAYPSIPTYPIVHNGNSYLGKNNKQLIPHCSLIATEKIDGEEIKILILNGEYAIKYRNTWLCSEDSNSIGNKDDSKVNYLKNIADKLIDIQRVEMMDLFSPFKTNTIYCIYGELYSTITQKSNYEFKVFDMWNMNITNFSELLNKDELECLLWSNFKNQPWANIKEILDWCEYCGLSYVPYLNIDYKSINTNMGDIYKTISQYQQVEFSLDDSKKETNRPKDIIIRSENRSFIFELNLDDYENTLKNDRGTEYGLC